MLSSKILRRSIVGIFALSTFVLSSSDNSLLSINSASADPVPNPNCDNINGWKAFTGKNGGGLNCCGQWIEKLPVIEAGNCQAIPPTPPN
jgi:hypothetical protein